MPTPKRCDRRRYVHTRARLLYVFRNLLLQFLRFRERSRSGAAVAAFDMTSPFLSPAKAVPPLRVCRFPVKTWITPEVDFDLNTFRGTNSPDASAGVSSTGYGILWNGFIQNVPSAAASSSQAGNNFVFFLTSDDVARLWIGSQKIIDKESPGLSTVTEACKLPPNQPIPITIQYTHSSTGPASMHIHWLSAPETGNVLQIVPAPASSGQ